MLVLGYFLLSVLSVRCEDDRREVKMFEDIESQDIIDNFDSFPLLRREVKPSGWCEVSRTNHRNSTLNEGHFSRESTAWKKCEKLVESFIANCPWWTGPSSNPSPTPGTTTPPRWCSGGGPTADTFSPL